MQVRTTHSGRSRLRRGMTLLELLLAVAILSALTLLIAAMWSQAQRWNDDATSGHRLLRMQRLTELMRVQWADRRTILPLGDKQGGVTTDGDQLSFVTTTPVLFPDWPMVVADYRIEEDFSAMTAGERRFNLVYTETKVAEMQQSPELPEANATLDDRASRRLVVLKGAPDLRWQRYGRDFLEHEEQRRTDDLEDSRPESAGRASTPGSNASRSDRPRVPGDGRSVDEGATPEEGDSSDGLSPEDERLQRKWRDMPPRTMAPEGDPPQAVRLIGTFEKEDFACVFMIGALRS